MQQAVSGVGLGRDLLPFPRQRLGAEFTGLLSAAQVGTGCVLGWRTDEDHGADGARLRAPVFSSTETPAGTAQSKSPPSETQQDGDRSQEACPLAASLLLARQQGLGLYTTSSTVGCGGFLYRFATAKGKVCPLRSQAALAG